MSNSIRSKYFAIISLIQTNYIWSRFMDIHESKRRAHDYDAESRGIEFPTVVEMGRPTFSWLKLSFICVLRRAAWRSR